MKKLVNFFCWSSTEKRYFFKALFIIFKIRIFSLRKPTLVASYYASLKRNERTGTRPPKKDSDLIDTIVRAVERASLLFPGTGICLVQALAAQALLEKEGFFPKFQIGGIFSEEKKFEAHAWLEYEEKIIIGDRDDLSAYSVFRESESRT